MSDEPKFIVSCRVGSAGGVASGSDTTECSECHAPVWRSPSSKQLQQEFCGIKFLCVECAKPQLQDAKPEDISPVSNGQLLEIASYFNISVKEAAERLHEIQKHLPEMLS
jgi:hypothetical protein